ncbi:hypothetical protein C8Q80DRAFT_1270293 [Daedaleopsis nitida]|nr:hypothetical protein C8Q80DRAFT_1270293 [Daedaleopsis nitida]
MMGVAQQQGGVAQQQGGGALHRLRDLLDQCSRDTTLTAIWGLKVLQDSWRNPDKPEKKFGSNPLHQHGRHDRRPTTRTPGSKPMVNPSRMDPPRSGSSIGRSTWGRNPRVSLVIHPPIFLLRKKFEAIFRNRITALTSRIFSIPGLYNELAVRGGWPARPHEVFYEFPGSQVENATEYDIAWWLRTIVRLSDASVWQLEMVALRQRNRNERRGDTEPAPFLHWLTTLEDALSRHVPNHAELEALFTGIDLERIGVVPAANVSNVDEDTPMADAAPLSASTAATAASGPVEEPAEVGNVIDNATSEQAGNVAPGTTDGDVSIPDVGMGDNGDDDIPDSGTVNNDLTPTTE